jgi:hypothetical protein
VIGERVVIGQVIGKVPDRMAKARAAKALKRQQKLPTLPTIESLMVDLEIVQRKIDNHLTEHWLREEAVKPKPWIYRCSIVGCTQIFTLPPPEDRVGQPAPVCPTHGQVELYPVSTPVAGYGNEG